jgi:hypothetical protein
MEQKELKKTEKSFVDYFIENYNIDTKTVQCIRTHCSGEKAILRVEYADFHKDYKPTVLAKQYLQEFYGYYPEHLNFNNAHHDRTGCSALNVYDVGIDDFNRYCELPTVISSEYYEKEDWGYIEFAIHNDRQCALSYERKLHEYFNDNNN